MTSITGCPAPGAPTRWGYPILLGRIGLVGRFSVAGYSADIRIGITGKTQLNALEKQLARINKSLNQINKGLKGPKINERATRSIDALDKRLQKLTARSKSTQKSQKSVLADQAVPVVGR